MSVACWDWNHCTLHVKELWSSLHRRKKHRRLWRHCISAHIQKNAAIIGEITEEQPGKVVMMTEIGTQALLPQPGGRIIAENLLRSDYLEIRAGRKVWKQE